MNINLEAALKRIAVHGPDRVIVDGEGHAVTPNRAKEEYQTGWDVIFIRDDGWTLGTTFEYEMVAYRLWKTEWTHFVPMSYPVPQPIEYFRSLLIKP